MASPRVTVVIPTYNRARFLGEAIESVLAQTFGDFELLIADDGSGDDTSSVVARFDDSRLRHLALEHHGISAALNAGLATARGELFARLDSDDVWKPEMLATLVPVLEAEPVGFVYGRGRAMRTDRTPLDQVVGHPPRWSNDDMRSLVYDDCTCNIAIVARRDAIIAAGGYDESLIAAEDWDLWLRVTTRAPFRFVDREVACFRIHGDNLTRTGSPMQTNVLDSRLLVLDKFFASPAGHTVVDMAPSAYRNVYVFQTMQYLGARRYREAVRAFARSVSVAEHSVTTAVRNAAFILTQQVLMRHGITARPVRRFSGYRRQRRTRSQIGRKRDP